MNCEEAEALILDLERRGAANSLERVAAMAHLSHCAQCAALKESWQAAREELRLLGDATARAEVPARVEMRLRQEFRLRHRTLVMRRAALVTAWALATAALLVGAVSWRNWQRTRDSEATNHAVAKPETPARGAEGSKENASANHPGKGTPGEQTEVAALASATDAGDFTLLPGSFPAETDDAAILRVRMQRGALGALGLPVNEESAGEWIQVDLLVGNDGLPEAVRLVR